MNKYQLILLLLLGLASTASQAVDYHQLPADFFNTHNHGKRIVDMTNQQEFKVENTPYTRGLYLKTQQGNQEKWVRHGIFYHYSQQKLSAKTTYAYGAKHGVNEDYYPNGQVKFEMTYQENKLAGPWRQYFDDGKLYEERSYSPACGSSCRHGKIYQYTRKGTVRFEQDWDEGKLSRSVQYRDNGAVYSTSVYTYKDGKRSSQTTYTN